MSKRFRPEVRNPIEYASETDEENGNVEEANREAWGEEKRDNPGPTKTSAAQNRVSEVHAAMALLMSNSLSSSTVTEYMVFKYIYIYIFF